MPSTVPATHRLQARLRQNMCGLRFALAIMIGVSARFLRTMLAVDAGVASEEFEGRVVYLPLGVNNLRYI